MKNSTNKQPQKPSKKPSGSAISRYAEQQNQNSKLIKYFVYGLSIFAIIVLLFFGIKFASNHHKHVQEAQTHQVTDLVSTVLSEKYSSAIGDIATIGHGHAIKHYMYNVKLKNQHVYPYSSDDPESLLMYDNINVTYTIFRLNTPKYKYLEVEHDRDSDKVISADLTEKEPNDKYLIYRATLMKELEAQDRSNHYEPRKIKKLNSIAYKRLEETESGNS